MISTLSRAELEALSSEINARIESLKSQPQDVKVEIRFKCGTIYYNGSHREGSEHLRKIQLFKCLFEHGFHAYEIMDMIPSLSYFKAHGKHPRLLQFLNLVTVAEMRQAVYSAMLLNRETVQTKLALI